MKVKEKYVLTFATDEKGQDIRYRFMVSMCKRLATVEKTVPKALASIDGVDSMTIHGNYTFEIAVCRAFDPEEVILEVKKALEENLSDIILPRLIV